MSGNYKFLSIWMNGNLHLLGFSNPTSPHKIWEFSLKWICTPNPIFLSNIYRYTPISMWNPQLYKSPIRNPCFSGSEESSIYEFLTCSQTWFESRGFDLVGPVKKVIQTVGLMRCSLEGQCAEVTQFSENSTFEFIFKFHFPSPFMIGIIFR